MDEPTRRPFDFTAAMAAKVHDCIDLALALSAGVDHLLDDFVALQEALVLLVPDESFNDVFQDSRLTDLRVLLSSIAGRIELVTDSPGLQMSPAESRQLRSRVAVGEPAVGEGPATAQPPPATGPAPSGGTPLSIVTLREKVARARESAERAGQPDD